MAALTVAELANVANAALDHYMDRGNVLSQTIQKRPLFASMDEAAQTIPGGKGDVSLAVKGAYTTTVAGYTGTDSVTYANPANIQRVNYTWKEHHAGISVTHTELKHDGISVVDSARSESTSEHVGRTKTVLVNLLKDKLEDMSEGYARGINTLLYGDGTADAKAFAGIQAVLPDDPTAAGTTVGGLSTVSNTWWRPRTSLTIAVTTGGSELVELIHTELRQLRRYGGNPKIAVCGSKFLDRLATELRSKGNYTQTGFSGKGATDIGMAEIHYGGLRFIYDPSMDDLTITSREPDKRCYIIDPSKLYLCYMEDEKEKRHSPARPHDSYVLYRAVTTTGALCASQLNCHGIYELA